MHYYISLYNSSNFLFVEGVPSKPNGPIEILDIQRDSATIQWKPPTHDGGSPLKQYIVEMKDSKRSTWKKVDKIPADQMQYRIENLNKDEKYQFRVAAENKHGVSEALETDKPVLIKSQYGNL